MNVLAVMLMAAGVSFVECGKCPNRMRFSADGTAATVNLSRVADREAMKARAENLLAIAADAKKGGRLRPLMGWSSWNTFALRISDRIILETAQAMATNGLAAAGYRYVNIDDGFFDGRDEKGSLKIRKDRFPNGLKPVADGIHALGLKAGIYSEAGADTCGSMWGDKDKGGVGGGLYGHDAQDCRFQFVENGFDFIKVDYCGGRRLKLNERIRYTEISKAIRATGKDVRFNICRWAFPGTWAAGIAESWRTTMDIRASWRSVKGITEENLYLGPFISPGHYNDMDMLEVGQRKGVVKTGFGKSDTGLTVDEETAHFGLWCFFSSPLLIGCDVRKLPEATRTLITNPFLLAMNQNDLAAVPTVVSRAGDAIVLAKDADEKFGTARYAVLFNADDRERAFCVRFADLELGGKVAAVDLVERADVGELEGEFNETLPPHSARFYRLDAERRLDRRVYEAEGAFLTDYHELDCKTGGFSTHKRMQGVPFREQNAAFSGGVAVGGLGGAASNDLVWRDVRVSDGEKHVSFRTFGGGSFDVEVDGRLIENGRNGFSLSSGIHTVRLFNAKAPLPTVDCMVVEALCGTGGLAADEAAQADVRQVVRAY